MLDIFLNSDNLIYFLDKHKAGVKSSARLLPNFVLLKGLHKEIKEKKGEFLLNSENVNQALMERLSSSNLPLISNKTSKSQAEVASPPDEQLLIKYLAHSFWRLTDEFLLLTRKLKVSHNNATTLAESLV